MSKEVFERLFEIPSADGSDSQASFLERTTIVTLACGSVISILGVMVTLISGSAL